MTVLHLNTFDTGGSYEYAALLATSLARSGVVSRILTRRIPDTPHIYQLFNRLARRLSISMTRETWHGTRRFLSPPSPSGMDGVDIVHLHTVGDWFNVRRWLEAVPSHVRIVVGLHDLWHVSGGCYVYQGCERFADDCRPCPALKPPASHFLATHELAWKARIYKERNVRIVANSRWLAEIAAKSPVIGPGRDVVVIPPAIDTSSFKPLDRTQCRLVLGLPLDTFIIVAGCASLTDPYKNMEWLLQQLAQLPDVQDVMVILFGDGVLAVPCGLTVRFVGPIRDRQRLAMLMAAADVFVSASRMETYGLTLVEAMACGTPVVAFNVGGITEAAPHGEASLLCEPGDGEAMLGSLTRLRLSATLRHTLGSAGRSIALARNSPDVFASSYFRLYSESMGTHCPS